MDYSIKLKNPKWQKKRLEIFQRDNFTCVYCSETEETLHVHHEKYIGENPWDTPNEFLKTVCETCHKILEAMKLFLKEYKTELSSLKNFYLGNDKSEWIRKAIFKDGSIALFIMGIKDGLTFAFYPQTYNRLLDFLKNE